MADLRDTPFCPQCGKPMRFVRTLPGIGGLPALHTYTCKDCGTTMTLAGEPGERRGAS
jgi:transposase-like protein